MMRPCWHRCPPHLYVRPYRGLQMHTGVHCYGTMHVGHVYGSRRAHMGHLHGTVRAGTYCMAKRMPPLQHTHSPGCRCTHPPCLKAEGCTPFKSSPFGPCMLFRTRNTLLINRDPSLDAPAHCQCAFQSEYCNRGTQRGCVQKQHITPLPRVTHPCKRQAIVCVGCCCSRSRSRSSKRCPCQAVPE